MQGDPQSYVVHSLCYPLCSFFLCCICNHHSSSSLPEDKPCSQLTAYSPSPQFLILVPFSPIQQTANYPPPGRCQKLEVLTQESPLSHHGVV